MGIIIIPTDSLTFIFFKLVKTTFQKQLGMEKSSLTITPSFLRGLGQAPENNRESSSLSVQIVAPPKQEIIQDVRPHVSCSCAWKGVFLHMEVLNNRGAPKWMVYNR
jgi:hypothetical protein